MYTEEYEKRGFPIRNFVLRLILVIIVVAMLIWLIPKFNTPKKVVKKSCSGTKCDTSSIAARNEQTFSENINKMKDAAISYYTDERLPKNAGESTKMTLSDMIGKKLIVALIDKNNKACDVEKSYVKITKLDDEYLLKVNLKDSEKEDYILVHLGCYTYCDTYICEKDSSSNNSNDTSATRVSSYVPIEGNTKNGKYYSNRNGYSKNYYYKTSSKNTKKSNSSSKSIRTTTNTKNSNTSANTNTNIKKSTNIVETINITKSIKYTFNNTYTFIINCITNKCSEDKDHDTPKPTPTESPNPSPSPSDSPSPSPTVTPTPSATPSPKPTPSDKPCEDKKCDEPTPTPSYKPEYLYEYKKVTNAKLSDWTTWSNWSKTNCNTKEINCSDDNPNCLYKLQLYKQKEKIGRYKKPYAKERYEVRQVGSYTSKSCNKFNYVKIDSTLYATTTSTTKYTVINSITKTTKQSVGSWKYAGRAKYSNPPRDGVGTSYKFVGADFSYCAATCSTLPNYYYDKYTYTGGMRSVSNTISSASTRTSTSTSSSKSTSTRYDATCGGYSYKTVPIYKTIKVTDKDYRDEDLYGTVCYKSTKKRDITNKATTDIKWSTYNDTSLLNDGWVYTGSKKLK